MESNMALVPYLDVEEMPEPHRQYAKDFERDHGRLPWLRVLATHYPPFVDAVSAMYPSFMTEGGIDRVTKELIFVACAETRGCQYCMGSHSRHLVQELVLTREQVEMARAGEDAPGLTPLQRLLIRFARKVAIDPQKIAPSDIDELRAAGLGDSEIVEVVAVCSFSAFTNTFTDTLKLADDFEMMGMQDEYF
jgi:uncharacterized peroxidase-related enzyme